MRHIFHKNLHKLYELIDRLWTFRLQIFIFLHIFHLLVQFEYQRYELLFIRVVILVKFYDPFLQNVKQRINAIIVRLLLKASGKARISSFPSCRSWSFRSKVSFGLFQRRCRQRTTRSCVPLWRRSKNWCLLVRWSARHWCHTTGRSCRCSTCSRTRGWTLATRSTTRRGRTRTWLSLFNKL